MKGVFTNAGGTPRCAAIASSWARSIQDPANNDCPGFASGRTDGEANQGNNGLN